MTSPDRMARARRVKIGVAGLGAIGQDVAARLVRGDVPGAVLAGVTALDLKRASDRMKAIDETVPVMPLDELVAAVDIVCECASVAGFTDIARAVLGAGKTLIAISVSAMARCPDVIDLAQRTGGRLRVAGGGLPGLDSIRAVCEDQVHSIMLKTTFRAQSMMHDPYVLAHGFDLARRPLPPTRLFEGSVAQASKAFPRHFNVAYALALGGIGPDRTRVEVWVDDSVAGTVQAVEVKADSADLTLECRTRPSRVYRSSRIVAPSIIAALRTCVEPVHIGS